MDAGRPPRTPKRDDVSDLAERESDPTVLRHERQQPQDVDRIVPVASCGATRGRQDSRRFVQPQRLAAQAASRGDFSDE